VDALIERARGALRTAVRVAAVVLFIGLVAQVPWVRDIDAAVEHHRRAAMTAAIALLAVSWTAFMGGVIYGLVVGVPPKGAGAAGPRRAFSVTVSFQEVKRAARDGRWLSDPFWRFTFYQMMTGALMGFGVAAVVFVLGNAGIKGLMVVLVVYAVVRTTWGFIKAG
jgi:hypothetical protein